MSNILRLSSFLCFIYIIVNAKEIEINETQNILQNAWETCKTIRHDGLSWEEYCKKFDAGCESHYGTIACYCKPGLIFANGACLETCETVRQYEKSWKQHCADLNAICEINDVGRATCKCRTGLEYRNDACQGPCEDEQKCKHKPGTECINYGIGDECVCTDRSKTFDDYYNMCIGPCEDEQKCKHKPGTECINYGIGDECVCTDRSKTFDDYYNMCIGPCEDEQKCKHKPGTECINYGIGDKCVCTDRSKTFDDYYNMCIDLCKSNQTVIDKCRKENKTCIPTTRDPYFKCDQCLPGFKESGDDDNHCIDYCEKNEAGYKSCSEINRVCEFSKEEPFFRCTDCLKGFKADDNNCVRSCDYNFERKCKSNGGKECFKEGYKDKCICKDKRKTFDHDKGMCIGKTSTSFSAANVSSGYAKKRAGQNAQGKFQGNGNGKAIGSSKERRISTSGRRIFKSSFEDTRNPKIHEYFEKLKYTKPEGNFLQLNAELQGIRTEVKSLKEENNYSRELTRLPQRVEEMKVIPKNLVK
ncbi:uncharacterized protein LOC111624760 [Centruroides sculpturatus]|uniref:uncharacterized protein LOC111624760 n=1 Tax=Centruroides sculpturatus TaxID=218467 RepID=UPI000C6E6D4E|nr:uncharacterized protein LOC111624760 [Centruroides sculpturatus]